MRYLVNSLASHLACLNIKTKIKLSQFQNKKNCYFRQEQVRWNKIQQTNKRRVKDYGMNEAV